MSVYSGFATRQQETTYFKFVEKAMQLFSEEILARRKGGGTSMSGMSQLSQIEIHGFQSSSLNHQNEKTINKKVENDPTKQSFELKSSTQQRILQSQENNSTLPKIGQLGSKPINSVTSKSTINAGQIEVVKEENPEVEEQTLDVREDKRSKTQENQHRTRVQKPTEKSFMLNDSYVQKAYVTTSVNQPGFSRIQTKELLQPNSNNGISIKSQLAKRNQLKYTDISQDIHSTSSIYKSNKNKIPYVLKSQDNKSKFIRDSNYESFDQDAIQNIKSEIMTDHLAKRHSIAQPKGNFLIHKRTNKYSTQVRNSQQQVFQNQTIFSNKFSDDQQNNKKQQSLGSSLNTSAMNTTTNPYFNNDSSLSNKHNSNQRRFTQQNFRRRIQSSNPTNDLNDVVLIQNEITESNLKYGEKEQNPNMLLLAQSPPRSAIISQLNQNPNTRTYKRRMRNGLHQSVSGGDYSSFEKQASDYGEINVQSPLQQNHKKKQLTADLSKITQSAAYRVAKFANKKHLIYNDCLANYDPVLKKKNKKKKRKFTSKGVDGKYPQFQQNNFQMYLLDQANSIANQRKTMINFEKTPQVTTKKLISQQFPQIQQQVSDMSLATTYAGGFKTIEKKTHEIQIEKKMQTRMNFFHHHPVIDTNLHISQQRKRLQNNNKQMNKSQNATQQNIAPEFNDLEGDNNEQEKQQNLTIHKQLSVYDDNSINNSVSKENRNNSQLDYRLPSIRSNETINNKSEDSRLSTLQQKVKIQEEQLKQFYQKQGSSDILGSKPMPISLMNQTSKASSFLGQNKFVGQNRISIKDIANNSSYKRFSDQVDKKLFIKNQQPYSQQRVTVAVDTPQANQGMTDEEKQLYGNRYPKGYSKISILGRGGCALVWLCKNETNNQNVAVKQFPKANSNSGSLDSGYKELQMNRKFFQPNGEPYEFFANHPGLTSLCKLLDSREDSKDLWLVFEVCGKPLSKQFFDVKGEFFRGERIYQVLHREKIYDLFQQENCKNFRSIIRQMASVLNLFQTAGIVHSDLKPENLMLDINEKDEIIFKIIDLGSSFNFQKTNQFIELTTPEYLSPDILEFLQNKNSFLLQGTSNPQCDLTKRILPWSIDIWSFGAILLELVIGFPLWLSYKGRIVKENSNWDVEEQASFCMMGLFGIQGRVPKKIIQKQQQTVKSLRSILKKQFSSSFCLGNLNNDDLFIDLLSKMLELNPKLRISPKEIEEHPFLKQ